MKAWLAQIDTTPGDFESNVQQHLNQIDYAVTGGADLIVFPEMSICGYLIKDMINHPRFVDVCLRELNRIVAHTVGHDITVVVGYVDRSTKENGAPFKNMAAVIRNGLIIAQYQKQLLPFYDVFDEPRYFEPGTELCKVMIAGEMCAITICEDLWNDKGQTDYNYNNNPVSRYIANGVKVIINLSSSPYYRGKVKLRAEMAREISANDTTVIYCNQIGSQDELYFDGHSFVARNGKIISFVDEMGCVDTTNRATSDEAEKIVQHSGGIDEVADVLIKSLRGYIEKTGHKEVVINSSGGVDSAVVIALAAKAIGGANVHCVMMPSVYSSEGSVNDAKNLHAKFGCKEYTVRIEHERLYRQVLESYMNLGSPYPVAEENLQARLRGALGAMFVSNAYGPLPLTTGNKTELALGYCTLYGDMSGGFNPIGDCYKDDVKAIGKFLGVQAEILDKAPSAELAPDQVDEQSLLPYVMLNGIVKAFIEDFVCDYEEYKEWVSKNPINKCMYTGFHDLYGVPDKDDYYKMIGKIEIMEFKRRQAAPCTKISKVAFGTGRRMPIVKGRWRNAL